jgi:serralysin
MQMQLVSSYMTSALGVSAVADGMALVVQNGTAQLIYSEQELNAAKSLSLGAIGAPGSGFVTREALSAPVTTENLQPSSSMAFQDTGTGIRAFLFDSHTGVLTSSLLGASGAPGATQNVGTDIGALRGVETFAIMGGASGDVAVLSNWNKAGLQIFHLASNGKLTFETTIEDSAKSYIATVSDTATVTLDGHDYLLTLSALENGITSYEIGAGGTPALIDSLGNHDGLWVSGAAALQTVQIGGVTYAVIAATGSSSLSVVRVNDMGCLFMTDHVVDDRTTRFEHPEVLDTFTLQGRAFVVAAGTDAGISVMELLPDGRLSPFYSVALETGAGLAAVTGLEVALNGSTLQIFVVDARADRIQKFEMSLASLGLTVKAAGGTAMGTGKDDLILGSKASEALQGGAGADWIHSGGGSDTLTGGSGADVFVFDAPAGSDRIADFELHADRIDLSDWGMIYSVEALNITTTSTGCTIGFGSHTLAVTSADGHGLNAAGFSLADFIF